MFVSETVELAMRRASVQTASTDEPQLDTMLELPVHTKAAQVVHGVGAFASRSLIKGELIGEYALRCSPASCTTVDGSIRL